MLIATSHQWSHVKKYAYIVNIHNYFIEVNAGHNKTNENGNILMCPYNNRMNIKIYIKISIWMGACIIQWSMTAKKKSYSNLQIFNMCVGYI